jgi:hypothetical protein
MIGGGGSGRRSGEEKGGGGVGEDVAVEVIIAFMGASLVLNC